MANSLWEIAVTVCDAARSLSLDLDPAPLRRLLHADVGRHPLGELGEGRDDAKDAVVRLQCLEGLDYLVKRLVGVERAEAFVDEQALQRLVPVCSGAEIGQAPGEARRQRDQAEEA